jgi:mitochondrial fission protein ELM1
MNTAEKKVLILTDGKAGHENQSKAFARGLGFDYDVVKVRYKGRASKLLSYFFDRFNILCESLFEILDESAQVLLNDPSKYIAVVGAGSGTFYPVKVIAKRLGVKSGVVLYPRGYNLSTFDCVLSPAFDRPKSGSNIVVIPANLVAADEAFYEKGVSDYRLRTSVNPDISVIIGGPNKCSTMTVEWMRAKLDMIFSEPGIKVVTTSRRTPDDVEALVDSYPWDWKLIYSRDSFNPIPAFVKLSKRIYVTAESTGMLSECCTFGSAEVKALDNLNPETSKFRRFLDILRNEGYVDGSKKIDLSREFSKARELMGV